MGRYTVTYTKGPAPGEDEAQIRAFPGIRFIDHTTRTMLIEADEEAAAALQAAFPDWTVSPERFYQLPDLRKRIKPPER